MCKDAFLTGIPLFRSVSEDSALFTSQKIRFLASRLDDVSSRPNVHLFTIPALRTTCHTIWTSTRLKYPPSERRGFPSGRLSSSSGRLSVFDQASDFLSKFIYGKIATTVRTTWITVQIRSSIKQESQFKFNRPDAHTIDMEIACRRSTIRTAILMVRTCEAFIWKLLAADVRPSGGRGSQTGKIFSKIFGILVAQLSVWTAHDHHPDSAQLYQARRSFEPPAYK
jgi:hypothetical protein